MRAAEPVAEGKGTANSIFSNEMSSARMGVLLLLLLLLLLALAGLP